MAIHNSSENLKKCLNCNTELSGKYCSECGQKSNTDRFTLNYIFNNLLNGFLYFEKGLPYTIKQLFLKPSTTVIDFLEGKRANLMTPFQYLLFGVSFLILSDFLFFDPPDRKSEYTEIQNKILYSFGYSFGEFIRRNLKFLWISLPIIHGFVSNLFYTRKNISEHIVINSYVIGHSSIIIGILLPLIGNPFILSPITYFCIWLVHLFTYKNLVPPKLLWVLPLLTLIVSTFFFILIPVSGYTIYYVLDGK